MSDISTSCPRCRRALEIPYDFDNVICPGCAAAYWIRRHGDLVSLSEMWPDADDSRRAENATALVESRLAEIDELMEEAEAEIESLRSREQSGPLQRGCAFFGLFMTVILVIAVFMLVGRGYVGSWLFYVSVAGVIIVGIVRIRRKLISADQVDEFRRNRTEIENDLTRLQSERDRLQGLNARLNPDQAD